MNGNVKNCENIILCSAVMFIASLAPGCSYMSKGHSDFDVRVREQGIASWYGDHFNGQTTANGEIYDEGNLTGAHRTFPFGTMVKVTNAINGLQVILRINDRGPYIGGRILDLSHGAAISLGMMDRGIAPVSLEIIDLEKDQDGIGRIWRALRFLSRWTAIIETAKPIAAVPSASPQTVSGRYETGRTSRPLAPFDIVLERRFRREAGIKAAESSDEDGDPELA